MSSGITLLKLLPNLSGAYELKCEWIHHLHVDPQSTALGVDEFKRH